MQIDCFKAYDIRGQIPNQLNPDIARRIANATGEFLKAKTVVIGRDMRLSSEEFANAVAEGLMEAGVDVLDIDLCGTEMVYFATALLKADGGIMITASHNPADYNGLKIVREDARPISGDTGLKEIRALAERDERYKGKLPGTRKDADIYDDYIEHLLSYIKVRKLKPLKVVANSGNGCASLGIDGLASHLPFDFIRINHMPDGTFPNGVPNPLLEENRAPTIAAIKENDADLGLAWDGDFDRCFFFDEKGAFVDGYYIVGLLAESILSKNDGGKIVHDPRLTWNTQDMVLAAGGEPVLSKSGHSFIKETMRNVDAVYGGEMSAHHYFREFSYADSGMIPWLLVAELISLTGKPLSELVGERIALYPASGEINREVADAAATLKALHERYAGEAISVDDLDGYSFEFENWRFNIRMSNTEPVIRLNVESRGDIPLMKKKTDEVLAVISSLN